jgi:hypothetical protein
MVGIDQNLVDIDPGIELLIPFGPYVKEALDTISYNSY